MPGTIRIEVTAPTVITITGEYIALVSSELTIDSTTLTMDLEAVTIA